MNEERKDQLNRIVIKGFKSIKECDLELNNINVLVGANGAGKSNFISAFELYNEFSPNLNRYATKKGMNTLFYNGLKFTDEIEMEMSFQCYSVFFNIEPTENNSLGVIDYGLKLSDCGLKLLGEVKKEDFFNKQGIFYLKPFRWYHFHDTSPSAKVKQAHNISNCAVLFEDARNLAAFLYRLKNFFPREYSSILRAIQRAAPYFDEFALAPEEGNEELIFLRWRQKGWEDTLNPSQLSDGTLRFICLATLLLQPTKLQPATIIIDEPELGLHPYAMTIVAELVKKVANKKQLILATQSAEFLDHFEAEDVIVVDRTANGSEFKRLDAEKLTAWLEDDYSLGELWNKNLFGGRVAR